MRDMSNKSTKARMQKEYVLWGIPKGKTSALDEQVLSTQAKTPAQMDAIKKRAAADGWHSFRVQILDMSKPYKGFGFSRPGAKAVFATEVGRKGNKAAMITRDGTGTWYAYVVQRGETGIGPFEEMLGTMRSYATEEKAKRAAIKALDTSGFSRPGAKAKMAYGVADAAPKFTKGETVADAVHPNRKGKVVEVIPGSYDAKSYTKAENQYIVSFMPKGGLVRYGEQRLVRASRPGVKAKMAKWTVTPTQKHGKDIEEHTAKIGRDHWKIDSMPHLGKSVGSLYRWDEMRGLRHISTGNIEQLKRQAEAISTKQDALSDVMRGFSRPGAKATMGKQWREGPYAFKNKLLAEDQMQLLVNEGSGWMNAGVFMDESDTIEASKSYVQMRKRGFVYEHGQWNKARASRPGAKDTNAVREGSKISAEDEACLKMMAAADEKVSDKIRTLIAEGKPQKQAVAIALDLKRRGEL